MKEPTRLAAGARAISSTIIIALVVLIDAGSLFAEGIAGRYLRLAPSTWASTRWTSVAGFIRTGIARLGAVITPIQITKEIAEGIAGARYDRAT